MDEDTFDIAKAAFLGPRLSKAVDFWHSSNNRRAKATMRVPTRMVVLAWCHTFSPTVAQTTSGTPSENTPDAPVADGDLWPGAGALWQGGIIDVFSTSDCSGESVQPRIILDSNGCESAVPAPWFPGRASRDVEAHLTMHCDAASGYARVCGAQVPDGKEGGKPTTAAAVLEFLVVVLPRCHWC